MRRVLLHLGLHKTGTTAAQSFLYDNRELIWPHFGLVLPYKTRKSGLAEAATRHSLYGTVGTLAEFGSQMRALLDGMDFGTRRGLIVSEENFCGLRPSRNLSSGYAAAPDLAACLVDSVHNRLAGEEIDVTVYLSLRQRGAWLRSLWAHDLQRTRLVHDFETFRANLDRLPSHQETVNSIRDKLPSVEIRVEWLEDLQERRLGAGKPFADFLEFRRDKATQLVPPSRTNHRLPESALVELLAANRSQLDEAALIRQKAAIVRNVQNEMARTA